MCWLMRWIEFKYVNIVCLYDVVYIEFKFVFIFEVR